MTVTSFPADLTARRAWQERQDEAERAKPLPAPEHTSRMALPEGLVIPRGVRDLAALAERHGWTVRITYSLGPLVGPRSVKHSRCIGVRCWRGKRYVLAFYVSPVGGRTWTFDNALVAGGLVGVFSKCSVTDVRAYLEAGGELPPDWFAAITARIADAAARAKANAKARPRKARQDTA